MKRLAAIALTAALLSVTGSAAAWAQPWQDDYGGRQQDHARHAVQAGQVMPLDRIIAQISSHTPGQLLRADGPSNQGGRMIYRILWDANGRQVEFIVDARSGQILR